MQSFAVRHVFRVHPEFLQGTVLDVADHMFAGKPGLTMEVAGVGMHQRPARTHVSGPGDREGPVFNVVAGIARTSPVVSCKLHIELTVEGFEERLPGCLVEIHFCKLRPGRWLPWRKAMLCMAWE